MLCKTSSLACSRPCSSVCLLRPVGCAQRLPVVRRAAQDPQTQQTTEAASSSTADATTSSSSPQVVREYRSLGSKVIESNASLSGPEDQKDFWEGEQFDAFGKAVADYFLPGLVLLGVVCGVVAAATYNDGANYFLKGPGSEDDSATIIIAPEAAATLSSSSSSSSAAPSLTE